MLIFGRWGMPEASRPPSPFAITFPYEGSSREEGGVVTHQRKLGRATLTGKYQREHPVKYPVETAGDAAALLDIWEGAKVEKNDAYRRSDRTAEEAIGEDGVFALTLNPSPIQALIEEECGMETFYYLMQDEPALMERLIGAMYEKRRQEYRIAAESHYSLVIPVENTSTRLVSPSFYRKYSLEHMTEFARAMHSHGKKAIVHMCGHIRDLLPDFREAGIDGIHMLTDPPVGDCPFEMALQALGEEAILMGVLATDVFQGDGATPGDIRSAVKRALRDRVRESNFILCPAIDGIATPPWKLEAVRDAVEEFGYKGHA